MTCVKAILVCFTVFTATIFTPTPSIADQELIITEISGTEGDDVINNADPVNASAVIDTSLSETVKTSATGIDALGGNDLIQNSARISSDASSTADVDEATDRTVMEASGVGVTGGAGVDDILNTADIDITAGAQALTLDAVLPIIEDGVVDISTTAVTSSTGIAGDEDADFIDNTGQVDLVSTSDSTAAGISLTVDGIVTGDGSARVLGDASATADAQAVGIAGGDGADRIHNQASVFVDLFATATTVDVGALIEVTKDAIVSGVSLSDSSALAIAWATGISGGSGADTLFSDGDIVFLANADATSVGVTLTIAGTAEGDATGTALTDTRAITDVATTGIAGGAGNDLIDNRSSILAEARATSTGVGVGTEVGLVVEQGGDVSGAALSDASVTATSTATGIDGGEGDDTIANEGMITLMSGIGDDETDASATAVSVALTVSGTMEGNVAGEALSDSSATADATAIGIDGGSGLDAITNRGAIVGNVDSSAAAVGVAVDIGITEEGDVSGAALSDASVTANAAAIGIDGGGAADVIDNRGNTDLSADSNATGVAVSLDVAGTMKGDAEGSSVSDASVTANAIAAGITAGEGNDTIINNSLVTTAHVDANATAVSVGLTVSGSMEGNVEGTALSDGSATADAMAIGIDGGMGQDTIENRARIYEDVDAGATTVAVGVDVAISIEEGGNASGAALSDASVTANAAASGIGGGGDADAIDNRGDIELLSNSDATGVAVALTVAGTMKGDAEGSSVSDASVTATSTATGIDGGEGDDTIDNEGIITLMNGIGVDETDASATAVSVALTVSGTMEGNVAGEALSDSSAMADAMAIGIDGGSGLDAITNRGAIFGNVDSSATAVGVGLDVSLIIAKDGDAEGNVSGAALSDASVTADAAATGIDGGENTDVIDNRGDIELLSNSDAIGVAASLTVAGSVASKGDVEGEIEGKALSNTSTEAYAEATGIDGGEDGDQIINTGNISLLQAKSSSTGVSASLNISAGLAANGNAKVDVTGEAASDASVTAEAMALGLDGGLGDDEIDNAGDIRLLSTSDATGVTAILNITGALSFKGVSTADVSGSAASNSAVLAKAEATGIDGGWGVDTIRNFGNITLMNADIFDADALGVSASLNISGNVAIKGVAAGTVEGAAASNATVTAEAAATGIDGGEDNDSIFNNGAINLLPASNADGIAASLNVSGNMVGETEGSAMSDASVIATSMATGIDGGEGADNITNEGAITLMKQEGGDQIDANALGIAASLDITGNLNGTAEGKALSKATTTADATAIGISGAAGMDTVTNTSGITADVDSSAKGVSVAAEVSVTLNGTAEGSSLSDVSTTANATAAGIDGGADDDFIDNSGIIDLFSDADATSTAVSVTISAAMRGQAGGEALSKATTTANATATGISGGDGLDDIINRGRIMAAADAETDTVAVTVGITVAETGEAEGAALSDSSSSSIARATGIDGGGNYDTIVNEGAIELSSRADAQATAVSVGLTGAMKGLAEGKSVADSSAEAISQSIGMYGGEGNDKITSSTNSIATSAESLSVAESVSVQLGGSVGMAKGAAVADSSATSLAYSAGLDGGLGNDTINNKSEIEATVKADAEASSTSVTATIALGSAETIGTGDSSATARANATGIEGGGEGDEITNTAAITVGGFEDPGPMASAQAGATDVTVGLAVGLNMSEASSAAAAIAEVNAAGISGGSGDDWIDNSGTINVGPDPLGTEGMAYASATSTTVDISVTAGASLGKSSSDTSSTAVANLAGIKGGSGNDTVYNSGSITVGKYFSDSVEPDAMATAKAGSETVSVGLTVGGSFKDASSNASATAHSKATGIETGLGADLVNNTGVINTFSSSEALGTAEAIKVSMTIGALEGAVESDASSLSTAIATGIDSGENADKIDTDSDFVVKALSVSTTTSNAEDLNILSIGSAIQSATANSSSTAEALAHGIDGGTGADTITVAGNYEVSADTEVSSTSRSSTVTGVSTGENKQKAQALAGTTSQALAIGIDGGEGNDVINSTATLTVNTSSNASTTGVSAANTGFNIAGSSSGESVAGATSNVTASGIGIRGGISVLAVNESDADVITNEGVISVTTTVSAATSSTSTADSITFIGKAEGTAVSDASAAVLADGTGIDGGADKDTITNKNTITVKTTADASVKSTSNVDAYATFGGASSMGVSDASANVLAEATGISGGTGDDTITSRALVKAEAESIGSVTATSNVDADVTFGGASSEAASNASVTKKGSATGIDGGDGGDVITNYDTLYVRALSTGTVTSKANAAADATFGSTSSITTTAAALEGAVDTAGIIGGSGGDWITNLGRVDSIADATLYVANSSVATAESTFGSSDARASSVSTLQGKASSLGVSGDGGDDVIENAGAVNVRAIANATVVTSTVAIADSFWGSEYTEAASSNYAAGESTAEGITAGTGNDEILNTELITVETGGEVKIKSEVYSSAGPASSDARTMALSHASGIDSGADDDNVLNTGTVFVKAAPRVISATRTFGMRGHTDGKVGIEFTANATGISGGAGIDTITNEGDILVFLGSPESESTVSEDATSGAITFTDNKRIGEDPEAIVGKWVRIQVSDGRNFVTSVEEFDPETGTFTLHDPIKYDLVVNDGYTLYDYGDKTPDILSVQVTAGGRTQVDASTTASVRAQGITGGEGDDQLSNSGAVAVSASNRIKAVTVTIARNIVADTRVESSVNAVGIAGNDQSDTSDTSAAGTSVFTDLSRKGDDPDAIIGQQVVFESGASAGFTSLVSEFDPDTGTFTLADPLPSGGLSKGDNYTLGGGSDIITNLGAIDVAADGAIDASNWSLNFGTADVKARGIAQTDATGIRGGGFADFIQNNGDIATRSTATVSSTGRVDVVFGSADQELFFEASSESTGVESGAGDDEFFNADNSSINAEALSTASVDGVTTTVLFANNITNVVDAIADSTSLGVDLGEGHNIASTAGGLTSTSLATVVATAISEFALGETNADADATTTAQARGIQAGSDGDQTFNQGRIEVNATADAISTAQGAKVGNKDETSSATEDGSEGDKFFFDASLIPADGEQPVDIVGEWVRFITGENDDFFARVNAFIPETGQLILNKSLVGDLQTDDLYTRSAARDGTSAATAAATAIGIDLGDGNAVIGNEGVLDVHAVATADTTASAFGGAAVASAEATADARGIVTGGGDDMVGNYDAITVTAEVLTQAAGTGVTEIQSATVRGIDTGAGVDTVLNEGEISVTAIAEVMEATVDVIGISTGDGDDILLNAGTGSIAASTAIAGITAPATAVSTGAGQDQVSLMDQSGITGHIDLGLDDDLLTLANEATAIGEVKGGAGTDTLRIEDRGMFTLTSPVEMERLEINQGVLEFNGDYLFPADGLVQAEIYNPDTGDRGHGQLLINGETDLDGTAAVIALPRIYTDGESLPLLSAESIGIEAGIPSGFATVSLPPDSALVNFGYDYRFDVAGRDLFEITTAVDPFRTVARNSLQRAVANYLERIAPTASGDLAEVIGTFQLLPQDANFDTAFSSLSPDTHDNYTQATFFGVSQYQETLSRRLRARRVDRVLGGTSSRQAGFETDRSLLLAYSGDNSDIRSLYAGEVTEIPAWWRDVWVTAFGQWGDQDGENGYTGFDYNVLGLTVGIDHPVSDRLLLGASAAYTDIDVDQEKGRGDGDIEGWMAALYSSYSLDKAYIDGALSYGKNDYDAKRKVRVGAIKRTARSDHDGDVFAASLGGGYLMSRDSSVLEPFGRLQYIKLDEDAFTEKGAGDINQRISSRDTESLTSEIGVRVSRSFPKAGGRLTTDASVAWLHDFDIDDRAITTSYTGAPASSFSIPGQDVERNGVTLGLGVGFETRRGVSSSLNYNGEFRDGFSAHGVIGRISYRF